MFYYKLLNIKHLPNTTAKIYRHFETTKRKMLKDVKGFKKCRFTLEKLVFVSI